MQPMLYCEGDITLNQNSGAVFASVNTDLNYKVENWIQTSTKFWPVHIKTEIKTLR